MTAWTDNVLSIDIETYSDVDITNGVYRYVDSPCFDILLFGYAFGDEPTTCIDLASGESLPPRVMEALFDPRVEKHAYNAAFERVCLSKYLGRKLPVEQWWCTAVHGRMFGLPGSLKETAKALGLQEQKDTAGTMLINYFSKPCRPTASNGGRTRNMPEDAPEKWALYKKYNHQDVVVERAISHYLEDHYFDVSAEKPRYHIDQHINDTGIAIDLELVRNIYDFSQQYTARKLEEFQALTGLENPNSLTQLKAWLATHGLIVKRLDKSNIDDLIASAPDDDVREALTLRKTLSKTSITKYTRMLDSVCSDGKIHGAIQFYGAQRTGRYAGRIIQVQNFPQNHLEGLAEVRELIRNKDWATLDCLYDDLPDLFKQLLRTMLIPESQRTYCVADYSAIEARVIAWLAHETWAEEVFHKDGKIYESTAAMMFDVPVESIAKGKPNYPLRQRGKVATLACGYGGGAAAMAAMDTGHKIPPEEYPELVQKWRSANPHIAALWRTVDRTVRKALKCTMPIRLENLTFQYKEGNLFIQLPSGRWLSYYHMRIDEEDTIRYWGTDAKGWCELRTWGGKLVENIVQAIARDELANALTRVESDPRYRVVFHIHDEIIAECMDDNIDLEGMKALMSAGNDWDDGLWLPAAGYTTKFYLKD